MNLLVEYRVLDKLKVINEGTGPTAKTKLRGIFQKCDEQNNNGRIYPRKILENQVQAIQEKIADRSLVGALDHPANDAIHLSQASHLVTKLWVEPNGVVMGECEILSTPNGQIVKALINDGVKIGISSRGLGTVSESRTGKIVNEDFKLITFDLVSDPSTKGAYPELTESIRENSNRAQQIVSKMKKDRILLTVLEQKIDEFRSAKTHGRLHGTDAKRGRHRRLRIAKDLLGKLPDSDPRKQPKETGIKNLKTIEPPDESSPKAGRIHRARGGYKQSKKLNKISRASSGEAARARRNEAIEGQLKVEEWKSAGNVSVAIGKEHRAKRLKKLADLANKRGLKGHAKMYTAGAEHKKGQPEPSLPTGAAGESAQRIADRELRRKAKQNSSTEIFRSPLQVALQERCWKGYKPVKGKKPYSKGSCKKK